MRTTANESFTRAADRVWHHDWPGEALVISRRRVNSTIGLLLVMFRHVLALTISFLLVVSSPASATSPRGQSHRVRRAISGRITDPNGAVVVAAKIIIVGRSSHTTVVKRSDTKGQYVADLEPDTYDVTAGAPGFKTATRTTGVLRGSRSYMDFVLDLGAVVNSPIVVP